MLLQILSGAVAWVLAFVLVFRTDTLARFVRIDANAPAPPVSFETTSVLRTGIVLVGLYVFATRIALALSIVSMYVSGVRFEGLGGGLARILIEMVPVALSLLFIFGADRVVDIVMREEKAEI